MTNLSKPSKPEFEDSGPDDGRISFWEQQHFIPYFMLLDIFFCHSFISLIQYFALQSQNSENCVSIQVLIDYINTLLRVICQFWSLHFYYAEGLKCAVNVFSNFPSMRNYP